MRRKTFDSILTAMGAMVMVALLAAGALRCGSIAREEQRSRPT